MDTKTFIIDRFFDIRYCKEKPDGETKIYIARIFKSYGEIEALHFLKLKDEVYRKIVLYHLYFIFENNDRDVIHADTCAFQQLFLEGYSIKQITSSFIELIKDMPFLSRGFQKFKIERIENLKGLIK